MKNFLSFINIDFLAGKDSRKNWRMLMFISFLIMMTIYSSHSADQKVFKISELKYCFLLISFVFFFCNWKNILLTKHP